MRAAAPTAWTRQPLRVRLLPMLACVAACQGPQLHLRTVGDHPVFVDGRACAETTLPFRYYGTTRWDALPNDRLEDGIPPFDQLPNSRRVTIAAPASPWLFPLDLPIELFSYAVHGRQDVTTDITVRDKPAEQIAPEQIPPAELGKLRARALDARVGR